MQNLQKTGTVFLKQLINLSVFVIAGMILFHPAGLKAESAGSHAPAKTGIGLSTGYTYDPSDDIGFAQLSVVRLYDYDAVWPHRAPENLRFKIEGAAGASKVDGEAKLIANAGILALLYLDWFNSERFRPYVEAGVGVIYTDYRVSGQDYRFNFNPQAGIGVEFARQGKPSRFCSLRAHHISNGGIGSSNRGQNSIVLTLGQYF